jgi:hypothetical protein
MKKLAFEKPKKISVSKLKKKAWKLFSEYIRRSAIKDGLVVCITCGAQKNYKEMQAGHWLPGRHPSVLFDQRNCHPQCYHCNVGLKGSPIQYYHYMENFYGKKEMKDLERLDRVNKQFKQFELEALIDIFKRKLSELGG